MPDGSEPRFGPLDAPQHREPPHDFAIEQGVIGGLLIRNGAYDAIADFLRPEHFADPLHGRIYQTMAALIQADRPATPVSLRPMLADDKCDHPKGVVGYLAACAGAAMPSMDLAAYARQIHDLWIRRMGIDVCRDLAESFYRVEFDKPAIGIVEGAEARLATIAQGQGAEESVLAGAAVLDEAMAEIDDAIAQRALPEAERRRDRIVTGIPSIDRTVMIGPGDLVIVAGAASMGKSALLDNIAEANEARGIGVGGFILEMGRAAWMKRRLIRATGISGYVLESGAATQTEYDRIVAARRELAARPCFLDDTKSTTPAKMRARMRRAVRKHGVKLFVVDYLQLIQGDNAGRRDGNRTQEIGSISRALKVTAGDLGVAVIAAAQINRGVDSRDDKRPTLADLRESGSIEQDADTVLFVYREEYYLSRGKAAGKGGKPPSPQEEMDFIARLEASRGRAEIIVAKQRRGEAGVIRAVGWDGLRTRFHDLAPPPNSTVADDNMEPV